MLKEFNDTGLCIPSRHYMVDTSQKLKKIIQMIEKGLYFTINRPRQFGKTTTLSLLAKQLNLREDYLALEISFEGIGDVPFASEQTFCPSFLGIIARSLKFVNVDISTYFAQAAPQVHNFDELSQFISQGVLHLQKQLVLLIDEVDKSSNNQIFLHFLGMLRNKYLLRNADKDYTFQSVILAGVHDIKTLKAKIRPTPPTESGGESKERYNSPWNIAIDFEVDLSFSATEIESMVQDYSQDHQIQPDIPAIAKQLHYYTSGYPYLVSKLCKFIDEKIVPARADPNWTVDDVEAAFKMMVNGVYTTTLFDSLTKNLENNPDLYDLIFQIVINGKSTDFIATNPIINLGYLYGILTPSAQGRCQIHNRIFEQRIYAHMMSKVETSRGATNGFSGPEFYATDGLDVKVILQRFQAFMQENYAHRDAHFLEREGRLLFLSFLKPIINGKGFDFKEPNVGDERRMDIVITYQNKRYVLELKIWYGAKAHQEGLQQLSDYLDIYGLREGYLLIYDFNKGKTYKEAQIEFNDKQIFAVWV